MNNEQFRRLVLDINTNTNSGSSGTTSSGEKRATTTTAATKANASEVGDEQRVHGDGGGGETKAKGMGVLGSKMRSNIPMTPRSTGVDFARQLFERRREQQSQSQSQGQKRSRFSAAPKGTKLPSGYQDRTQLRQMQGGEGAEDDKEDGDEDEDGNKNRGDRDRDGSRGDSQNKNTVKGLDWELLRRVKAGEDVNNILEEREREKERREELGEKKDDSEGSREAAENVEDMDEEFERVLEEKGRDVAAPVEEKKDKKKKGNMAPPPPTTRSRDEILKQLKASRAASGSSGGGTREAAPAESRLGAKFKKFGETKADRKRWVEHDEHGRRREILVVTDAQGKSKRKVKWLDGPGASNGERDKAGLLVPNKDATPLGMDVPAELLSKSTTRPQEEKGEDDDIFEGVGADYNPLGDLGEDDDDDSSAESDEKDGEVRPPSRLPERQAAVTDNDKEQRPTQVQPRNYFSTSSSTATTTETAESRDDRSNPLAKDPTILATLKRAAALRAASPSHEKDAEKAGDDGEPVETSSLRSKKFLEEVRRREMQDAQDMDLGFGESRVEDEEEEEPVVLEGTGGGGGSSSHSKKRKRGPKKKKGDKDSASDVLRVMEGRKKQAQ